MKIVAGIYFIIIGILSIMKPRKIALFGNKWKFRNAEPSEMYLLLTVVSGVFAILFGVALLFFIDNNVFF